MKVGTYTNLNMLNLMTMFFCHTVDFLAKFGSKNQNCLFKMKLVTYTNSKI